MSSSFTLVGVFLFVVSASAHSTTSLKQAVHATYVPLTNGWTMWPKSSEREQHNPDATSHRNEHIIDAPRYTNVTMPATVLGALITQGYVPFDPMLDMNLARIDKAPFRQPWVFQRSYEQSSPPSPGFSVHGTTTSSFAYLFLDGVNYKADVSVNGQQLFNESEVVGTFRRFHLPLFNTHGNGSGAAASVARKGGRITSTALDSLRITVTPAVDHTFPPGNNDTDLSIVFIDWNPPPPDRSLGLWRRVEVQHYPAPCVIDGLSVAVTLKGGSTRSTISANPSDRLNGASLVSTLSYTVMCASKEAVGAWLATHGIASVQAWLALNLTQATGGPSMVVDLPPVVIDFDQASTPHIGQKVTFAFNATVGSGHGDVKLWWPHGMGNRTRYSANFGLSWTQQQQQRRPSGVASAIAAAGLAVDHVVATYVTGQRFGFRQVTRRLTPVQQNLQFLINGVPLLIRGGGWNPDLFLRSHTNESHTRLRLQLESVLAMGLNTVRLEGKMEEEAFFEYTDALGILVLPGWACCDAWQHWSAWKPETYVVARESLRSQVRRLAVHASVITFFYSSDELPPEDVEAMYLKVFSEELWSTPTVASAAAYTSNITGVTGVKMTGPYSWVPPVYWLSDSSPSEYPLGGAWGFLTEGGPGEAPMVYESWLDTMKGNTSLIWQTSGGGGYDGAGMLTAAWDYHCGNPIGLFRNLRYYKPALYGRYGGPHRRSGDEEDPLAIAKQMLYKSQLANYEGIRALFEGYSRNKFTSVNPPANFEATGVINWMMNNAWPSHIWHLFDWFLRAGGGFYGAKQASFHQVGGGPASASSSPATSIAIHPVMTYVDGNIWLVNNGHAEFPSNATDAYWLTVQVVDLFGNVHWSEEMMISQSSNVTVPADGVLATSIQVPLSDAMQLNLPRGMSSFIVRLNATLRENTFGRPVAESTTDYWMSTKMDMLNWTESNFFRTACSQWADFSSLTHFLSVGGGSSSGSGSASASSGSGSGHPTPLREPTARVDVAFTVSTRQDEAAMVEHGQAVAANVASTRHTLDIQLRALPNNTVVAFAIQLRVEVGDGDVRHHARASSAAPSSSPSVPPVIVRFSDNYFTLLPGETRYVTADVEIFYGHSHPPQFAVIAESWTDLV